MRISQAAEVVGEPLSTLKDLNHRKILEMADGAWIEEKDEEIRAWGSFSVPSVMVLAGASQIRRTYGMSWPDAITFAKSALMTVSIPVGGVGHMAQFFDLNGVPEEIWVGRCDFDFDDPVMRGDWNYFFGNIAQLPNKMLNIIGVRAAWYVRAAEVDPRIVLPQPLAPRMCVLLNASQLCRETWEKVRRVRGEDQAN